MENKNTGHNNISAKQMAKRHANLESNFGKQTGVHVSAYLNESDADIKLNIMCRSTG